MGMGDMAVYRQYFAAKLGQAAFPNNVLPFTPNLDRMASEGTKFVNYYSPGVVCSPSRAGLLTGRYPIRTSVFPGVSKPENKYGLPQSEITIAKWLKTNKPEYFTAAVGKWHLGHFDPFLPRNHGFDEYFGIPYSHDYCPCPSSLTLTADNVCRDHDPGCPVMNGSTIIQQPMLFSKAEDDFLLATMRYVNLSREDDRPFFIYYNSMRPHHPQFARPDVVGKSFSLGARPGPYGDTMYDLDRTVGSLLEFLQTSKLKNNTYVFFTSDNGAATELGLFGGNNFPFRCGKTSTWDGGSRVPMIVWGGTAFGAMANKTSKALVSGLDLFPTIATLLGLPRLDGGVVLDGFDFSREFVQVQAGGNSIVNSTGNSGNRTSILYFPFYGPQQPSTSSPDAIRVGQYKVHFAIHVWQLSAANLQSCKPAGLTMGIQTNPLVYDVENDLGESTPLSEDSPEYEWTVIAARAVMEEFEKSLANQNSSIQLCYLRNGARRISSTKPFPPVPFRPWRQITFPCCPRDQEVVVYSDFRRFAEDANPRFDCAPLNRSSPCAAALLEPAVIAPFCNPTRCDRQFTCRSKTNLLQEACQESSICPPDWNRVYCPLGMHQCSASDKMNNVICVANGSLCSSFGGVWRVPRPCGWACMDGFARKFG